MVGMSIRTARWPAGTPCWVDLAVPDMEAATGFYEAVLGWAFDPATDDTRGYRIARRRGAAAAAVGPRRSRGTDQWSPKAGAWTLYFASDDVEYSAFAITAAGGELLLPPGQVGREGRLLVASDPAGAAFGVWQAGEHIGAELVNEPGGLTWEDLRSTDPDPARDFYKAVFGFQNAALEMAGPDYCVFSLPGEDFPLGGMGATMGEPGGSHWLVYFGVDDADAAAERALDSGGAVHRAPFETPFGRMAGLADPAGAGFMAVQNTGQPQPDRSI